MFRRVFVRMCMAGKGTAGENPWMKNNVGYIVGGVLLAACGLIYTERNIPHAGSILGKGVQDAWGLVCGVSFKHTAGLLILCDTCSASYHPTCIGLDKEIAKSMEDGWKCPICAAGDGATAEDREARLVRILRRQSPVKKLWTSRASTQPFNLEKYLINLWLGSEQPIPMEAEAALGGLDEYPLVKSARMQACQNALQYVSKRFLEGGLARGATELERVDFVEYAADVAYLCTNICLYSSDMTEELIKLGKQLLRRWTKMVKEETKDLSVDPHFVMSFAERVVACKRLGMYDDPAEGLSFDSDIAMLKEATEEAGVASLVCAGKFASAELTGPDAPVEQGEYPALCSNCGEDLGTSRVVRWRLGRCLRCHWPVTKTVPYGDLVESLVWPSLYEELGVCFVPEREIVFDTLRIIRRLRPYRHPQDIGLNAWKLQAYLITHVLYVLSEWGSQPLSSTTLHYEYHFVNEALTLCMGSIDDPELGGELVQCLRIFDAGSGGEDTAISRRVSAGVCYLLSRESSSEPGRWTRGLKTSIYDDYHTTMCVLVGLSQPKARSVTITTEVDKHSARVHEWLAFMEDEESHPYDQTYEVVRAEPKQPRTRSGRISSNRKMDIGVLDDCNIMEYTKIAAERRKALASLEARKRRRDTLTHSGISTVVKEDDLKGTLSSSVICSPDNVVPQNPPSSPVRRKRGPVQCGICGCSFSLLRESIRCAECRLAVHLECLPRSERTDLKKTDVLLYSAIQLRQWLTHPLAGTTGFTRIVCHAYEDKGIVRTMCDAHSWLVMVETSVLFTDGLPVGEEQAMQVFVPTVPDDQGPIKKGQYLVPGHVYSSHGAEQSSIQKNKGIAHCPCVLQCALSKVQMVEWFKLIHSSTGGSIEFEVLESHGDFSITSGTESYRLPATQSSKCCYCLEPLDPLERVCVQQCSRADCSSAWHVGCNPPKSYLLFANEHEARAFSHHECGSRH
ncbi:signal recognition particle subunit srp68 [Perkinsus chesapeaki]|uniref:Signal recognition particle subunit srp68 n=1 Tax=Perkinsus chesapeaki TaxID=330153 RepID=A0A7J6MPY1_PERCH|nr:signal recognition particle subunit srp68 [Perkinsus chesapeaki]